MLAACSTAEDRRVLVVGDSLVEGTSPAIEQGLRSEGWDPVVDGRGGLSIGTWASLLQPVADRSGARTAVVVLGTNDCAPECRDVEQGIDRVMHTLESAGVGRVLWLNVQEDAAYPEHPDKVNGYLRLAAQEWPQLQIVDLNGELGGRPALHTDGVHFNDAGAVALAQLITRSLDDAR